MPRKRKYRPKPFESTGKSNDTSANIYESMLTHPAFLGLTKNQRFLYLCMKAQYYGKRKPGKDHPEIPELQADEFFYFSRLDAVKYGITKGNGNTEFYKDVDALERAGFIETVVNGRATKKKSIYRFSDKWWTGIKNPCAEIHTRGP